MSEFSSVGTYLKRVSRQPGFDLKREAGGIVIGLLAIILFLIIQFEMGWIKGRGPANSFHKYWCVREMSVRELGARFVDTGVE